MKKMSVARVRPRFPEPTIIRYKRGKPIKVKDYPRGQIIELPITALIKAKSVFNPVERELKNLKPLVNSLDKYNFLRSKPISVGSDGRVADGHERITAAWYWYKNGTNKDKERFATLPACIEDLPAAKLFAELNKTQGVMTSRQLMLAVYGEDNTNGLPIENVYVKKTRRQIEILQTHGLLEKACKSTISPEAVQVAQEVTKEISLCLGPDKTKDITEKSVLLWMIDQAKTGKKDGVQKPAKDWVISFPTKSEEEHKANCRRVVKAIRDNAKLASPIKTVTWKKVEDIKKKK